VVVIIRAANKKKNGTRKKPTRSNLSAEMSRQKYPKYKKYPKYEKYENKIAKNN